MKSPESPSDYSEHDNNSPWDILVEYAAQNPSSHFESPETSYDDLGGTERKKDNEKILIQKIAENILPYLSLNELSNKEISDVLWLSHDALKPTGIKDKPKIGFLAEEALDNMFEEDTGEKLGQAKKLFCASLYEHAGMTSDNQTMWDIHDRFFSFSPNIASHCGDFRDNLELLGIAEQIPSNNNILSRNLYDEFILNASFSDINEFEDILEKAKPREQLYFMPIIFGVSQRCYADDYSNRTLDKTSRAFDEIEHRDTSTPLAKILAEYFGKQIDRKIYDELHAEWIDIDPLDPEYAEMIYEYEAQNEKRRQEQEKLRGKYNTRGFIREIAPDVAAIMDETGQVKTIINMEGQKFSPLKYDKDNTFGINREDALLLGAVHNYDVEQLLDEKLGIKLSATPLDSQIQLLKFMAGANNERFDRLCSTLKNVDEKLRPKLAENFIAADFGEDFGDSLLDIANSERISGEQLGEILDTFGSCRASIKNITSIYKDFDNSDFAKQYARAANERLTDALAAFREIAQNGVAVADLDWAGAPKFDCDSALEALKYEEKSLAIIDGVMRDVIDKKSGAFAEIVLAPQERFTKRTMYNFYSPDYGYCLLYTRPEGSSTFDSDFEYGNPRTGVEASISFIANPENPFSIPNPFKSQKGTTNPDILNKVSAIRLDREGRSLTDDPRSPNRHANNDKGIVSVDLAAINDRADTPSGKIARLVSVGNKIRNKNTDSFSLNHNTAWFDQGKYGVSDGFKEVVDYVDSLFTALCSELPPSEGQGFTGLRKDYERQERARNRRVA